MNVLSQVPHGLTVEAQYLGNGPGGSPNFLLKGAAGSCELKTVDALPTGLSVGQPILINISVEYIPQKRTSFGVQLARLGVIVQSVTVPESAAAGSSLPGGNGGPSVPKPLKP